MVKHRSDPITEQDLWQWYEVELLSDAEIAGRVGTYQVKISRLRKRWGISTISQPTRSLQRLPALTDLQRQTMVGSLLGDGWCQATSMESARFSEGHCEAQAAYTQWKADILQPFTSNTRTGSKAWRGKVFQSFSFSTVSCPQFREFYDLFYPPPERVRMFPSNLPDLMTPLVFAIWYMDDGSLGKGTFGGHTPRISYGLDDVSLKRAIKAVRRLGLEPKVYGEGGDRALLFMSQARKFRDLIEPHVPPCMAYKLPVESPRQAKDRNARVLTSEIACRLSNGGMSDTTIASMYGVGVGTVRRRIQQDGILQRKRGPKGRLTIDAVTARLEQMYPDTALWNDLTHEEQDEWVQDVLLTLRKVSFPYPEMESEDVRDQHLNTLRSMPPEMTRATTGLRLCYPFFPNRYHARYRGVPSAYEAWFDDKALKRAIRWQFKVGDPVTPRRVLRAITANSRTPTVFRPAVAKALYQMFCPVGGTVWDPCAGFGGRLLGAYTAGVGKYIGTDVAPETVEGNKRLAEWLGVPEGFADVRLEDASKFEPSKGLDMVFTSPPYFQQERYVGGEQSWQHDTFEAWVDGFLRPMIQQGAEALKSGGYWVLNIADVKGKGVTYPLVEASREVLGAVGLVEMPELRMPLSNLNRSTEGEPVLVWRKG